MLNRNLVFPGCSMAVVADQIAAEVRTARRQLIDRNAEHILVRTGDGHTIPLTKMGPGHRERHTQTLLNPSTQTPLAQFLREVIPDRNEPAGPGAADRHEPAIPGAAVRPEKLPTIVIENSLATDEDNWNLLHWPKPWPGKWPE